MSFQTTILAGGCFWCLEAVFQNVRGVRKVESGYIGGQVPHPNYEAVCNGDTGHAEAVRIEFDPTQVSFRDLLEVFFVIHDPTQLNRQGNDVGTQYRSAIYVLDEQQQHVAQELISELRNVFTAPIVTEVSQASTFYVAEDYHQNYFRQHPQQGYCAAVIAPKLAKFRQKFKTLQI